MLKFNPHKENCTGCSACYSACPVRCISMKADEEGFLYPESTDECIECGLCERVCPSFKEKSECTHPKSVYAAVSKDYAIWHRSTSGGAFSEIVRHWTEDDSLIVGAAWRGFTVHHIGVVGFRNITPLCKSKYMASSIEDTFIEIRTHLQKGKKAVFCGCPCQVDGLRKFLRKEYEHLLTIDLICHGQGSPLVFAECIKEIGTQLDSEVLAYEFRTKRRMIEEEYMSKVSTANGIYYIVSDPYQQLFLKQDILRPSCGDNCKYRDIRRPSDLTIADCKGLAEIFPDLKGCKRNYSTIVCNTRKGEMATANLSKTMYLRTYRLDDVIKYNPLFAHQTWSSQNRDTFFRDFLASPLETIRKNTRPLQVKRNSFRTIIKSYLPFWMLRLLCKR